MKVRLAALESSIQVDNFQLVTPLSHHLSPFNKSDRQTFYLSRRASEAQVTCTTLLSKPQRPISRCACSDHNDATVTYISGFECCLYTTNMRNPHHSNHRNYNQRCLRGTCARGHRRCGTTAVSRWSRLLDVLQVMMPTSAQLVPRFGRLPCKASGQDWDRG